MTSEPLSVEELTVKFRDGCLTRQNDRENMPSNKIINLEQCRGTNGKGTILPLTPFSSLTFFLSPPAPSYLQGRRMHPIKAGWGAANILGGEIRHYFRLIWGARGGRDTKKILCNLNTTDLPPPPPATHTHSHIKSLHIA